MSGSLTSRRKKHEIVIESRFLGADIIEVVSTLLHEMTHLGCRKGIGNNGVSITDVSNNTYHNRRFKAMTEAHGLKTEHIKTYGWMITHPTPELIECIQENGWKNFETFEIDVENNAKSPAVRGNISAQVVLLHVVQPVIFL